jgi:hypothetical protein
VGVQAGAVCRCAQRRGGTAVKFDVVCPVKCVWSW